MNKAQRFIARLLFGRKAFTPGQQYTIQNGRLVSITDNQENYIKKVYDINDMVSTVVNVQLEKIKVAPFGLYKMVEENGSTKSSLTFIQKCHAIQRKKDISSEDFFKYKKWFTKALEPYEKDHKWKRLLDRPNESESWAMFIERVCGYKLLTGNTYVWADLLGDGAEKGMPNALHVMPAQYVQIKATDGFPGKVTAYELATAMQKSKQYTIEEVLHDKYPAYNYSSAGEQFYGQSKLKSAIRRVNRSNSAIDAAAAKFQNGGLDSVVFTDDEKLPIDVAIEHANLTKKSLVNEYTGPLNQGKIAVSPYKVGVATLGLSPVDLAIIDSEKWDLVMIASVFGVPPELVGHTGTKTYDNIKTAEKALTSRCALPTLISLRDSLNYHAHKYWGLPDDLYIDFDMSVYSELQEDMGQKVIWVEKVADMTGIPVNRILELSGLEGLEDPIYDEPRITDKMGQFLSEWQTNDVDNALNEEE
jgi:HK97 family phage portal protein